MEFKRDLVTTNSKLPYQREKLRFKKKPPKDNKTKKHLKPFISKVYMCIQGIGDVSWFLCKCACCAHVHTVQMNGLLGLLPVFLFSRFSSKPDPIYTCVYIYIYKCSYDDF